MLPNEVPIHDLRCPHCGWSIRCGAEGMLQWLQTAGKLRRAKEPPLELLVELFTTAAAQFRCPQCHQAGLAAARHVEEDDDQAWGMARRCAGCAEMISVERLEIFPDERLCARCKAAGVDPSGPAEVEYCERCGGLLVMRQARGAGVARYVMSCSDCRR